MKSFFGKWTGLLGLLFLVVSCNSKDSYIPDPVGSYARGADCSWLTEQEQDGVLFADSLGRETECMRLMRNYGINAVRLRVWVNHATGWCNKEDVLVKAKRAHDLKLRIMIDFHYSDYFADPSTQTKPTAWQNYTLDQLCKAVADHTTDVLNALSAQGITPEWVQVGNETTNGMLWPTGQLWSADGDMPDGWKNYALLERAGYDAIKAVFPDTKVVVHIDNAYKNNNWFYQRLLQNGGRFDIIGLSHYPMKYEWSGLSWQEMNAAAIRNMALLHSEFNVPVMLAEIGTLGTSAQENTAAQVMSGLLTELKKNEWFAGVFYWEPQIFNDWRPKEYIPAGWSAYDMGAFKALKVRLSDSETRIYGTPNAAFCVMAKP